MDTEPALGRADGDDAAAPAQVVELGGTHLTSLEAIDRRRLELWVVTTVVVAVVGIALLMSTMPEVDSMLAVPPLVLRGGVVALALAFCGYAIEKELALRRLTRLLVDERLLTSSLTNRLSELSSLLAASKAMNSVLEVEEVIDIILASALELLDAETGSVMLVEGDELRVMCAHGNPDAADARVRVGEGIAGRVAESHEPILITGKPSSDQFPGIRERRRRIRSAMCVPLLSRGELLGVLSVNAPEGRSFTEHDLRALSVFAEQAAGAVANAHLYRMEQDHVGRLVEIDRMKSEFIASVNHDLRTPLTLLLGGASLARRPGLPEEQQEKFLEAIERQARHLASMIDTLLTAADLEQNERPTPVQPVDVAAVARHVCLDLEALDRKIEVDAPQKCIALTEPGALRRVLINLLDNAYKHGAPPVRVVVKSEDGAVTLSVIDSGPGVPPEHRERIFDRFFRLDPNRTLPGMGLGLSIVRTLVATCGGEVHIDSAPGGGTAVHVALRAPATEATLEIDTPTDSPAKG